MAAYCLDALQSFNDEALSLHCAELPLMILCIYCMLKVPIMVPLCLLNTLNIAKSQKDTLYVWEIAATKSIGLTLGAEGTIR